MTLILYDDAQARATEPFALTRPFGELRAGGLLIRERWERVTGMAATGFVGAPHLSAFDEAGAPASAAGKLAAGTLLVHSRFCPAIGAPLPRLAMGGALVSRGQVVAVALEKATDVASLAAGDVQLDSLATRSSGEAAGWWLDETWDIVRLLPEMLAADAAVLAAAIPDEPPAQVSVLGEYRLAAARGSYFEPHVVVDTSAGDVVVGAGARIGAFTRLAGPIVIGEGVQVNGGRISCCSIGAHSRVAGEMSVVVVTGHANKAHDGFVGHSIIGRWANLGAGTTTSNLKNSYGPVRVQTSRGEHDTGMQFLGSLIGDHAKTAIGTRLNTGTIVGAGANVFGDRSPDKRVPPFAWGDRAPFEAYALDKFLQVAALVMKRRDVVLSAGMRNTLAAAWEAAQR